jgi:hypothetical protein
MRVYLDCGSANLKLVEAEPGAKTAFSEYYPAALELYQRNG